MAIDQEKLESFLHRVVGDLGAAVSAAMVLTGDRLGLYKAMRDAGPLTPKELATRTHTAERYVREWLNNQAAGGYVAYDAESGRFTLPEEQATALADETSPFFIAGGFQITSAIWKARPQIEENFRTGHGLDWCDHDPALYEGTERFFKPLYVGNLVQNWIPALEGVDEKLRRGARVADVGCGHGASTLLMAQAYPNSEFTGFDYHHQSVEAARARAREARLTDRVSFHVGESTDFPGSDFDLVCHFDCLHDMGDPYGAARHVREVIKKDGTWMIVEPYAEDGPELNHNPVGRVYYGASTFVCVPASLAHEGPALGAQAGFGKLKEVAQSAGFSRVRRAITTPFNQIIEARV
ncbi:MAG: methyltransferase domain-containing protein [Acidobacteria bacterium]|nr:methyltransferase domain-containing protein [Acidobacteriota bacterium]